MRSKLDSTSGLTDLCRGTENCNNCLKLKILVVSSMNRLYGPLVGINRSHKLVVLQEEEPVFINTRKLLISFSFS